MWYRLLFHSSAQIIGWAQGSWISGMELMKQMKTSTCRVQVAEAVLCVLQRCDLDLFDVCLEQQMPGWWQVGWNVLRRLVPQHRGDHRGGVCEVQLQVDAPERSASSSSAQLPAHSCKNAAWTRLTRVLYFYCFLKLGLWVTYHFHKVFSCL